MSKILPAIEIRKLSKSYRLYTRNALDRFKDTFLPGAKKRHNIFQALKNIDLTVETGEILGIIGRNGAGKSTLLKIICGISPPTSGTLNVQGRVVPLLELGAGFNPEFSGRDNIYFYCSLQGMKKERIDAVYQEIVNFAELEEFIDLPVKRYSSGMRARLGFATSINIEPEILILDEVLSVGDELFKRKCFVKMEEFFKQNKTVIYVSHSLSSITQLCTRAVLLHKGTLLLEGPPEFVVNNYRKLLSEGQSPEKERRLENSLLALNNDSQQKKTAVTAMKRHHIKRHVKGRSSPYDFSVQKAFFAEGFESKGKRLRKKKDIDILNCSLTDLDGERVNHILWGEDYTIRFSARFHEAVKNVRFGCIISNARGVMISGSFGPERLNPIALVSRGEIWDFETQFAAYLKTGLYAVKFVVRGRDSQKESPVANLTDGIVFHCSEGSKGEAVGKVVLFHPSTCFQQC